ncbi:hypothetical protein D3C72_2020680 [compost metagenome]
MIQEGVIRHVQEELAGSTVFIGGTRHRNSATQVTQAIIRFVLDRCLGGFLLHIGSKAAALNHKARDHAVENSVVVVAAVHVVDEVLGGNRSLLTVERQFDIPC